MKLPSALQVERLTPIRMFASAVTLLVVAVVAVVYGHLAASRVAPWLSIVFSTGAVACTIVSLVLPSRR